VSKDVVTLVDAPEERVPLAGTSEVIQDCVFVASQLNVEPSTPVFTMENVCGDAFAPCTAKTERVCAVEIAGLGAVTVRLYVVDAEAFPPVAEIVIVVVPCVAPTFAVRVRVVVHVGEHVVGESDGLTPDGIPDVENVTGVVPFDEVRVAVIVVVTESPCATTEPEAGLGKREKENTVVKFVMVPYVLPPPPPPGELSAMAQ